ncbi:MAG: ABC transporter ATP-binding protein [bacterium]|nr:ABC transporter ATP-binding protein [bacterium]
MEPIISAEKIAKRYKIGEHREMYHTLSDSLLHTIKKPLNYLKSGFKNQNKKTEDFWALKDISFSIARGEAVGIIGRNGAGKSTLLKILSRITDPTYGQIIMRGRVASLLEVGTGFHPELTGRENIYLNGSVLGMKKREIDKKFDEIVEFAEITKFIDTPIKRYSSGMYTRLAFAVAANLDPEILVVDEVLSVGDIEFQKKCLGKMDNIAANGRTVIYVSHQLESLALLCNRCLLLDKGELIADGASRKIIDLYISRIKNSLSVSLNDRHDRKGRGGIRFTETWVENGSNRRVTQVISGENMKIVALYNQRDEIDASNFSFSFCVFTAHNTLLTNFNTLATLGNDHLKTIPRHGKIECIIPQLGLNSGDFYYSLLVTTRSGEEVEDYILQAGMFSVEPGDYFGTGHIAGKQNLIVADHSWKINGYEN